MSTPAPDKSSLPDPSYHWTTLKAQVFLGALAENDAASDATDADNQGGPIGQLLGGGGGAIDQFLVGGAHEPHPRADGDVAGEGHALRWFVDREDGAPDLAFVRRAQVR